MSGSPGPSALSTLASNGSDLTQPALPAAAGVLDNTVATVTSSSQPILISTTTKVVALDSQSTRPAPRVDTPIPLANIITQSLAKPPAATPSNAASANDSKNSSAPKTKDVAKPGTVASRISMFNTPEAPKAPSKSIVSVAPKIPSKVLKPKPIKIVPAIVPLPETVEIHDPEGTIAALGRRQAEAFEEPAARRTSNAYEHRKQVQGVRDPLHGKICRHHRPGDALLVTEKGIVARPRHHSHIDTDGPWAYWTRKDDAEMLPADRCDECLVEAGLPPRHFQIKIGHVANLSKPSQCVDTSRARLSNPSEEQQKAQGTFCNALTRSQHCMQHTIPFPHRVPKFSHISSTSSCTIDHLPTRLQALVLADYKDIKSMLDEITVDQSNRLRDISHKLSHEVDRISTHLLDPIETLGPACLRSDRSPRPTTDPPSKFHAYLVTLYAVSTVLRSTADAWAADLEKVPLSITSEPLAKAVSPVSVTRSSSYHSMVSQLPVVTELAVSPPGAPPASTLAPATSSLVTSAVVVPVEQSHTTVVEAVPAAVQDVGQAAVSAVPIAPSAAGVAVLKPAESVDKTKTGVRRMSL